MLRSNCAYTATALLITLFAGCSEQIGSNSTSKSMSPLPAPAIAGEPSRDSSHVFALPAANPQESARSQEMLSTVRELGQGPGMAGDRYAHVAENDFVTVSDQPLSTFSIDVDTASYSKTRMYLLEKGSMPPVDAVRIEELINYFDYDYAPPVNGDPFALHVEVAQCPWNGGHLLARVALKGREINHERPPCNLVFLLDVSGSMEAPNRLALVQQSLRLLVGQLNANDRVSVVVYAGAAGMVLPPTCGDKKHEILQAVEQLRAGGSTNGGTGIQLAYRVAKENHIPHGVNRVILCTDGDFNVGVSSTGDLVRMAESEARAGVFLSVLGFGMGNHNDAMLEEISDKANGMYAFIDGEAEARKVFVEQIDSTLVTIAKDVKIQIEFNPLAVTTYRLIGYENRKLAAHEFNDDQKDAGEIGAGHRVTALYELVPAGSDVSGTAAKVDELRYQDKRPLSTAAAASELMAIKLRYKHPDEDHSRLVTRTVQRCEKRFGDATADFRFASSVAAFGMLLRRSAYLGDTNWAAVQEIAAESTGPDSRGYRREFLKLIDAARRLENPYATVNRISVAPVVSRYPVTSPVTVFTPSVAAPATTPESYWRWIGLVIAAYFLLCGTIVVLVVMFACRAAMYRKCEREPQVPVGKKALA